MHLYYNSVHTFLIQVMHSSFPTHTKHHKAGPVLAQDQSHYLLIISLPFPAMLVLPLQPLHLLFFPRYGPQFLSTPMHPVLQEMPGA